MRLRYLEMWLLLFTFSRPKRFPEGLPSVAWFALTRKGGQLIPLSQCNCRLAVYPEPRQKGSSPIMNPALKAVSAARYQNILGADIVFPKAGAYELELSGTPKNGATFRPFRLTYEVNVVS